MNNEELEEKKKWFFKENIRLEELRKNLEQQQGKLEKERTGCGDSEADAGKAETQSGFAKKAVR